MNPRRRTYQKHWIPWIKKNLIKNGIPAQNPWMPEPWYPDYRKFKERFERYNVDKKTILIGHSCGCAFLVRWLGDTKREVNKLILVAPWKVRKGDRYRKAFYTYPIDPTIKLRVKEIIMFTSDDEKEEGKKSLEMFHQALGGKVIELKKHGHYTQDDMGTGEFPELLEAVLN